MRVLLVEDDPGIGRFVSRGLGAKGYDVQWERLAAPVPALAKAGAFAAILLDLGLPDGDGLDLCGVLRGQGVATPVLMLTARGTLQDRLDGFDRGADDYLAKPFAFDELVARLRAIVRRNVGDRVTFDTLVLDSATREARAAGQLLSLGRREFDLLARLAAADGAVVARSALIDAVWGDAAISDNSLDVVAGHLRRALGTVVEAPMLETLRGRGLRLVPKSKAN